MSSDDGESDHDDSEEVEFDEYDVDEFYDEEYGDYLNAYGGMYEHEDEDYQEQDTDYSYGPVPKGFPPKISSYVDVDNSKHPILSFNLGKEEAWDQTKQEVEFIRERYGVRQDATLKIFEELFDEDSKLFDAWKDITGNKSLADFSLFMATFFLECRLKTTYQDIYEDKIIDTSNYLSPDQYRGWWKKFDDYHKTDRHKSRAWELIEDAFNVLAKEVFIPNDEFMIRMTCDDDKHHFNFGVKQKDVPLDENSYLKRERHVKDNAPGMVADVCVYTGSGFPVHIHYRRKGETEFDSVKDAFKYLFNFGSDNPNSQPNLSGKVELAADRGYWRIPLLSWVLTLGAGILGTVMRQPSWFPFDWGRKKSGASADDGPQNIATEGSPCMYQKTASHNFGKTSNKDHSLTSVAFRNGYSSAVAMLRLMIQDMTMLRCWMQ